MEFKGKKYNEFKGPQYNKEKQMFYNFILNFEDNSLNNDPKFKKKKYLIDLQKISNKEKIMLEVELNDLEEFFNKESEREFIENIKKNTFTYLNILSESVDEILMNRETKKSELEEFEDALNHFRNNNKNIDKNDENNKIRKYLNRNFQLTFKANKNHKIKINKFRDLNSKKIGSMIFIKGIISKISEVKPLIDVACYLCEICGFEIYKKVNSNEFTPINECPSTVCENNNKKGNIIQNFAVSKFIKFQEIKIQELSDDVSVGSIPKTLKLKLKGDLTNRCFPGEEVLITGIYLPEIMEFSFHNKDNLMHDTFIEVLNIDKQKQKFSDININYTIKKDIIDICNNPNYLNILINSICPEIFGHEEVKLGLLLQLVGGNDLETEDGLKIRGNINIALIGDPGVAKSQFLKTISNLSPRSIYSSGKGTSGAGLTASVIRDTFTNEIMLEGGALVMSDLGICCIDEFDKMDDSDRASIHEVMEQQTISIAKAGIVANLNARCSILAAANPIYGRYNTTKSVHENINLPYSLISRFDLIFIMLDKIDFEKDNEIAEHITKLHKNMDVNVNTEIVPNDLLKAYISFARNFNPQLNEDLSLYITQKYIEKRKENNEENDFYITSRTLLSILRLSQGLAKLRFSDKIDKVDVNKAFELIEFSQNYLNKNENNEIKKNIGNYNNLLKKINGIINDIKNYDDNTFDYIELKKRAISKGISNNDLDEYLNRYEKLGVLFYDEKLLKFKFA